ncbi:MAG: V-type ATP synthase subunit A [Gemmatimonadota bacterium]|nr:V-type ATP synthase subunit A [Gemmatimonadota bacterium]
MSEPRIVRVSGALAEARPMRGASLYELVRVGEEKLLAEVIRLDGDVATIQVFEETSGLALGEPVEPTGQTLLAELGPGLLGSTLDGVGRPLVQLAERSGAFLAPGGAGTTLDRSKRWAFEPARGAGEEIGPGDVLGEVEERPGLPHRILVPPEVTGRIASIEAGDYAVDDPFGALEDGTPLTMLQRWPVRRPRPVAERLSGGKPMLTGQRIFDFLFPVAEGGAVAVPGGFGTGKTVIEQSLAKYAAADIVVYIGCGERGNEMAELLTEFPEIEDPRTGRPVMDRTVLVVNTSNMPVVAREASVFLGITMSEYYRDMGYRVALMADSLSRWAEALREIAARLQEMPGEEGYPTYLSDRMGKLFERAGRARALGEPERTGALTFIAAISPPGGDFSEPVTQACLRVAGALWALDPQLANQRQFPAVDWDTSYSLFADRVARWFHAEVADDWGELRRWAMELLQRDRELREISGLVGPEALEDEDRLILETARTIRELILGQSAFDPVDAFSPVEKTHALARLVHAFHEAATDAIEGGAGIGDVDVRSVRRAIDRVRGATSDELQERIEEAEEAIEKSARKAERKASGTPAEEEVVR